MQSHNLPASVLFFDGVCNLCNRAVQFVLRHEAHPHIQFATLQGPAGQRARAAAGGKTASLIFYHRGVYFTGSTAALKVAAQLRPPYRYLAALLVVPPFLRDGLYRLIASNRYRWFGKKASCMLPAPALRARFIEP